MKRNEVREVAEDKKFKSDAMVSWGMRWENHGKPLEKLRGRLQSELKYPVRSYYYCLFMCITVVHREPIKMQPTLC